MTRGAGRLVAAAAVAVLLLGLGGATRAVDSTAAPTATATAVGHDAAVVAIVGATRLPVADHGSRGAALASTGPARWALTAAGARDATDGTTRTPAPHLLASTGDRAPPALP